MKESNLHKGEVMLAFYMNHFLYWYFHFDQWHCSPYIGRPYAISVVNYLTLSKNKESIVEIGCGLGSILRRVPFHKRLGYDEDKNALRAARFLSKVTGIRRIVFDYFHFPESSLEGNFDAIVLINWIHNVSPNILSNYINNYFHHNLKNGGSLIIDIVKGPNYKYHHDIDQLTDGFLCSIKKIYEDKKVGREVFAIIKNV